MATSSAGCGDMSLEEYLSFYRNSPEDMSVAQLHKIINLQGFEHNNGTKRQLLVAVKSAMRHMPPTRSTVRNPGSLVSSSCRRAIPTVDRVQADLAAIGWDESPVESVQTISLAGPAALTPQHQHALEGHNQRQQCPIIWDWLPGVPPSSNSAQTTQQEPNRRRRPGRPPKRKQLTEAVLTPQELELPERLLHPGGRPPKPKPYQEALSGTAAHQQQSSTEYRRPRGRPPKKKVDLGTLLAQPSLPLSEPGLPPQQVEQEPQLKRCNKASSSLTTLHIPFHELPSPSTPKLMSQSSPPLVMPTPKPHTSSPPGFSLRSHAPDQCHRFSRAVVPTSPPPPPPPPSLPPPSPPHPPPPHQWVTDTQNAGHVDAGAGKELDRRSRALESPPCHIDVIELDSD